MQRLPWLALPCTLVLALGAGACDDAAGGTPDAAPGPDAEQLDSGGGPVDAGSPDATPQACIEGYRDPDFYARYDFRPYGIQIDQLHEWLAPLNARACTETHADSVSTLYTMVHTYDNSTGQRLSSVRTPTQGAEQTTTYEYDKDGNLTSTHQTLTQVGLPTTSRVTYAYDGRCNTTLKSYDLDADGTEDHQHSYAYDAAGRLITSLIPDGGPGQYGSTATYTYNLLGFPDTIAVLESFGGTTTTDKVVYLPDDTVDRMDIDFNEDTVTDGTRDFTYGDGDLTPSITVTENFGKGARQWRIFLDSQQRIVRWERGFSGGGTTDVITFSYGCFKTSG